MANIDKKIFKDVDIQTLLSIMEELDSTTKQEVLKAIGKKLTNTGKESIVANIKRLIQSTDPKLKNWISTAIPNAYVSGLNQADKDLERRVRMITIAEIKTLKELSVHADAINALMSDTYLDFANGMNGLLRGAQQQINQALKLQIRSKIVGNVLTGANIRDSKKQIIETLGSRGFSVLIDRGGTSWTLPRYSEMLARTHTIRAFSDATINRAEEFGVDLVEISSHGGSCPICVPYEGNIYSLSGANNKYPKYDIDLPIHPNCTHNLIMRPDLQNDEDYR